jgi:hypothetical protein
MLLWTITKEDTPACLTKNLAPDHWIVKFCTIVKYICACTLGSKGIVHKLSCLNPEFGPLLSSHNYNTLVEIFLRYFGMIVSC